MINPPEQNLSGSEPGKKINFPTSEQIKIQSQKEFYEGHKISFLRGVKWAIEIIKNINEQ
jgi:hypothetical protein